MSLLLAALFIAAVVLGVLEVARAVVRNDARQDAWRRNHQAHPRRWYER